MEDNFKDIKGNMEYCMKSKEPLFIEVLTTDECNCNCDYCFECDHSKKNIDNNTEHKIIALIVDQCNKFDKDFNSILTVSFWGGEPFMNYDFIKAVVDSTSKYDFVKYHIYTNGTLSDKINDFIEFCRTSNVVSKFHVQLSYDGEPHNTIKRHNDGSAIIANAKKLKDAGFDVGFKATLSYDMIKIFPDIWDSYEKLYYEFDKSIVYYPTLDMTCSDDKYFDDFKEAIVKIAAKEYEFIRANGHPLLSWFDDEIKKECNISNSIYLHSDGKAYVCHGCPYVENKSNFELGEYINERSLDTLIKTVKPLRNDICRHCGATYCAICHVMNMNEFNKDKQDIVECWNKSKTLNDSKCRFYQYFGMVHRMLKLAILKSNNI